MANHTRRQRSRFDLEPIVFNGIRIHCVHSPQPGPKDDLAFPNRFVNVYHGPAAHDRKLQNQLVGRVCHRSINVGVLTIDVRDRLYHRVW
jgi:hypothetical protein